MPLLGFTIYPAEEFRSMEKRFARPASPPSLEPTGSWSFITERFFPEVPFSTMWPTVRWYRALHRAQTQKRMHKLYLLNLVSQELATAIQMNCHPGCAAASRLRVP